jgi:hypothetical protein
MSYKEQPDIATARKVAEALGRAYAASVGAPWPMPPEAYGPGLQPVPREAYYQRYWQSPLDASGPTTLDPKAPVLPIRIEVDAVAQTFNGQKIATDAGLVTLDFAVLTPDPVATATPDLGVVSK